MKIPIVYEDDNFLVIDKPSGLITHPKDKNDTQYSVTEWLVSKYPQTKNVGTDHTRPGIVHRLDKDTSGLLILAKNEKAFSHFKEAFKEKKIKKHYLALVHGRPKTPSGTIDAPMGRIGLKRTTQIIGNKLRDKKEAETEYKTVKNFSHFTLLDVLPKTGRTHQIRVHLKSINTPIAGDKIYGLKKIPPPKGLDRLFLHAYKLEFTTPDNKSLALETDIPANLKEVLDNLE